MESTVAEPGLVRDAFLGSFLGKAVYRLTNPKYVKEAIESLGLVQPWMVEAKVPVEELRVLELLSNHGFRLIETNVQLDCSRAALNLNSQLGTISIREARSEDRSAIERVAADNLITSRFHLDQRIGPELGRRIKGAWAGNYFEGRRGDGLLVAECNGVVGGFLLVLERDDVGVIDLIALDPVLRGSGVVGSLMDYWLRTSPEIQRVVVGTQIANQRSLRAYGKVGFRVCDAAYVLHCHGPQIPVK